MILYFICTYTLQMAAQTWIGTWATAPQTVVKAFMPYNNNMTNRSVRQIVKVSVGGDVIRLKLSNIYSMQPVVIRSIYIAHAKDSFKIDAKSAQYFKFGNSYKATIPARQTDSERCPEVQSQESGARSHHHQLHLGSPMCLPFTWDHVPPLIS